jgi:hypothetical protein
VLGETLQFPFRLLASQAIPRFYSAPRAEISTLSSLSRLWSRNQLRPERNEANRMTPDNDFQVDPYMLDGFEFPATKPIEWHDDINLLTVYDAIFPQKDTSEK